MKVASFYPLAMIILSFSAAISYALEGDIRHAVYWIAAATITASVTF